MIKRTKRTKLEQYRYLRSRGFSVRKALNLSELVKTLRENIAVIFLLVLFLAMVVAIYSHADKRAIDTYSEANDRLQVAADRAEKAMLSCLNSGYVVIDQHVHECRPVATGVTL